MILRWFLNCKHHCLSVCVYVSASAFMKRSSLGLIFIAYLMCTQHARARMPNERMNEWMNEEWTLLAVDAFRTKRPKLRGRILYRAKNSFWSIRSVDMSLDFVSHECSNCSCSTSESVDSFLSHDLKNRPINMRNPENIVQCARKRNIAPQDWKIDKACCSDQNSSVRNLPASW